jgi:ATP-dependent Clp protease ATP-binding subunit ClpA
LKIQNSIERAIEKQDYFWAAEFKEKEESLKKEIKQLRSNNSLPKHLRKTVECDDIWEVLSDKLWIPVDQITDSEIAKLRNLDKLLSSKLLWQEDIIKNIVDSIKRNRLSVIQKDKPIASFLFLWPSWVGKTYIAKLLANDFFGDPKSLTRVDMSEFMEKHSASKLIWSAPW